MIRRFDLYGVRPGGDQSTLRTTWCWLSRGKWNHGLHHMSFGGDALVQEWWVSIQEELPWTSVSVGSVLSSGGIPRASLSAAEPGRAQREWCCGGWQGQGGPLRSAEMRGDIWGVWEEAGQPGSWEPVAGLRWVPMWLEKTLCNQGRSRRFPKEKGPGRPPEGPEALPLRIKAGILGGFSPLKNNSLGFVLLDGKAVGHVPIAGLPLACMDSSFLVER